MKCPKCKKADMIIDEWNGWVWTCFICDYVGRSASYAEIKNFERNLTGWLAGGKYVVCE